MTIVTGKYLLLPSSSKRDIKGRKKFLGASLFGRALQTSHKRAKGNELQKTIIKQS